MEIININGTDLLLNVSNKFLKDADVKINTVVVQIDGTILYYNSEHDKYLKEDFRNKKLSELLNKEDYEEVRKLMLESMFTGKEVIGEIKNYNRFFKMMITPVLDEQSNIKYLILNFYDITKNKKIENEIEQLKQQLNESNSIKSTFLSNVSHELKTPMNAIIGFSDILLSGQNMDHLERFLKSINSNAKHLEELLNNILDYSRLESNEFDILYENFSIHDLFDELYDIFEDVNYKKNLDFVKLEFIKNDDKKIISDYLRLKQILYNIISNSIKFTDRGYIKISFSTSEQSIIFKIEDTGIGIEENKFKYVFDRFWQYDSSSTKKYKGVGLGLSISKRIVDLLGGEIYLESTVGKGTTFFIKLSLEEKQESENSKDRNRISFINKTVLIVDELPVNYSLLGMFLKSLQINIVSTYNSEDAIRIYKEQKDKIDLIFLDLNLIDKDFNNLIKHLKKINNCIIISRTMSKNQSKYLDYYLKRPINKEKLLHILNEIWQE